MFKFSSSEVRKKFDSTASELHIEENQIASTFTQEYQILEGKLKHDSTGEQSGINWGMIYLVVFLNGLLMIWMMFCNKAKVVVVASLSVCLYSYYMYTYLFLLIGNSLLDKNSGTGFDYQLLEKDWGIFLNEYSIWICINIYNSTCM